MISFAHGEVYWCIALERMLQGNGGPWAVEAVVEIMSSLLCVGGVVR
jgi:hypothetical protein